MSNIQATRHPLCPIGLLGKALSSYDAPDRYYHTLEHGHQVAKQAHRLLMLMEIPYTIELDRGRDILEMAGVLHDCRQGPEHEMASAVSALAACPYRQFRNQIAWLIIAGTAHDYGTVHARAMAADAFLIGAGELPISDLHRPMLLRMAEALHDADVAGFGEPNTGAYLHRSNALFKEFCFKGISLNTYSARRREFLEKMKILVRTGTMLELREKTMQAQLDANFDKNMEAEFKWLEKIHSNLPYPLGPQ